MASDSDTLLIFKMRGIESKPAAAPQKAQGGAIMPYHEELPEVEAQPQTARSQPKGSRSKAQARSEPQTKSSIYYKESGDYPNPMLYYKEALKENDKVEPLLVRPTEAPKSRADSKEKAKDLFCSLHPFRHAYAICSYCHRPFCFEDIIEYQKDFYCIEDIDRIETRQTEKLTYEYSSSSLITSFILIGAFLLFLYYTNGQLGYIFNYIITSPSNFLANINLNLSYVTSLLTLGVMLVSFGAALYIFLGSKEGHIGVAVVGILTTALFVYLFATTGTQYMAIIAIFEFGAFLAAVHSAASGAQVYNQIYEKGSEYNLAYGYGAQF
jgi:hypothetical protein